MSVFETEIMHVKYFSTWARMNMQHMLMLFIPINPGLIAMANRTYQGSRGSPDPQLSFQPFTFYALNTGLQDTISIKKKGSAILKF